MAFSSSALRLIFPKGNVDSVPHSTALLKAARSAEIFRLMLDRDISRDLRFDEPSPEAEPLRRVARHRSIRAVLNSDSFRSSNSRNAPRMRATCPVRPRYVAFIHGS